LDRPTGAAYDEHRFKMGVPVELLRRVPLMQGLPDEDLTKLAARFRERVYDRGAPVVSRGSSGAGFFIIAEGEAIVGSGARAAPLRKHDFFGEIALIDGGRRSADITAATNLRCWGVSHAEFRAFVKQHPEVAWALLEVLVARLRAAESAAAATASRPRRRRWRLRR
jgi:CRP/FNR family transcriptional regulator, cyclic AMP receptor protein